MQLAVLADEIQKEELLSRNPAADARITWVNNLEELLAVDAAIYMDLQFTFSSERCKNLLKLSPKTIVIHAVESTLREIQAPFIRLNAWPGFLGRPVQEVAMIDKVKELESLMTVFNWSYKLVPDEPGLVAGRILSMVINEAYLAWEEGISTREDIDVAMTLGTGYPYGPFQWSKKIGLLNISRLLLKLASTDGRYKVSRSLLEEAGVK